MSKGWGENKKLSIVPEITGYPFDISQ